MGGWNRFPKQTVAPPMGKPSPAWKRKWAEEAKAELVRLAAEAVAEKEEKNEAKSVQFNG